MEIRKSEELVKYVGKKFNHTQFSNKEMVISCIEEIALRKGRNIQYDDTWLFVKDILRTKGYNIQSIMRMRYEIFGSSDEQKEEEYQYWSTFSKNGSIKSSIKLP